MAGTAADVLDTTDFNAVAVAGYSNGTQAAALEAQGILPHVPANRAVNNQGDGPLLDRACFEYDPERDVYACPAGQWLRRSKNLLHHTHGVYGARRKGCAACAFKSRCTLSARRSVVRHIHEEALNRMNALATPEVMRLRSSVVEHPFATLKYAIFETPRFLLRGLHGAGMEMALATLAYNPKRAVKVLGVADLVQGLSSA